MEAERHWTVAERRLDPAHPTAAGHFPGNPIIPGAVLLDEILCAIPGGTVSGIRAAKFLTPVRPGDRLVIRWAEASGAVKFEALLNGDKLALSGVLVLRTSTA